MMDDRVMQHIHRLRPTLDVHGKWVTCGNAKTAQKSMMLGNLDHTQIVYSRGHRNWRRVWDQIILPQIDGVFFFTFVRNPWDRIVSAFHFLQGRGTIARKWEFRDYLRSVLNKTGVSVDRHFRAQLPTFWCHKGFIPSLFIGRFEKLQQDWEYVANQINAATTLPHINSSKHAHYTTYYDDQCRKIVQRLYRKEIEVLGYEFGK